MHYRDKLLDQCINRIENAGSAQIAEVLRKMGREILRDSLLDSQTRQETIESLRTLCWEASLPSAERNLEVVEAAFVYIPPLLNKNLNILNYFQTHLEDLRKFFGIPP